MADIQQKSKSRKMIPLKYSCEEVYERMENGLCIFCEEKDSSEHQKLKHKGIQIVCVEDDQMSDDEEIQLSEAIIVDPIVKTVGETLALKVQGSISDVLPVPNEKEVRSLSQQSSKEDDRNWTHQVFDEMPVRKLQEEDNKYNEHQVHGKIPAKIRSKEKSQRYFKTWKFKFKTRIKRYKLEEDMFCLVDEMRNFVNVLPVGAVRLKKIAEETLENKMIEVQNNENGVEVMKKHNNDDDVKPPAEENIIEASLDCDPINDLRLDFPVAINDFELHELSGLQLYHYGETILIPLFIVTWRLDSFYESIKKNHSLGLHTLLMLDIRVKESTFESLQRWRPEPYIMISISGRWIPSPLAIIIILEHEKEFANTNAAGRSRRTEVERTHTDLQGNDFEDILHALTLEGSQIKEVMGFDLDNADVAGEVVEVRTESLTLKETPNPIKVARLMFVSNVLHNSSAAEKNAYAYQTKCEATLYDIMESFNNLHRSIIGSITAEALKERVLKVWQVWADWLLFSVAYVNIVYADWFLRSRVSDITSFPSICGDAFELKNKSYADSISDIGKINPDVALAIGKGGFSLDPLIVELIVFLWKADHVFHSPRPPEFLGCQGDTKSLAMETAVFEILVVVLVEVLSLVAGLFSRYKISADAMNFIACVWKIGMTRTFSLIRDVCDVKLPSVFNGLKDTIVSDQEEAIVTTTNALKNLIFLCIDESLVREGIDEILNSVLNIRKPSPTVIEKLCTTVESLLVSSMERVEMADGLLDAKCYTNIGTHQSMKANETDIHLIYLYELLCGSMDWFTDMVMVMELAFVCMFMKDFTKAVSERMIRMYYKLP